MMAAATKAAMATAVSQASVVVMIVTTQRAATMSGGKGEFPAKPRHRREADRMGGPLSRLLVVDVEVDA
jgi:hypothetical protein